MEGPLSKWTNLVVGWQYRWFVLDDTTGVLSYYTSKESLRSGVRKGCIVLKGAFMGIDDEDDCAFTITAEQKTYHFQAKDSEERDRWLQMLENVIAKLSNPLPTANPNEAAIARAKIKESDLYLQFLIEQGDSLRKRLVENSPQNEQLSTVVRQLDQFIEHVKYCITALSLSVMPITDSGDNALAIMPTGSEYTGAGINNGTVSSPFRVKQAAVSETTSCSGSEDEESFFDAVDNSESSAAARAISVIADNGQEAVDELYDNAEEDDLGSLEQHGSMIMHLLSQVHLGMDLTKVVLPTFILEKRSLLEMYADFFSRPDLFCDITAQATEKERMLQCVKWYIAAFQAGRRSQVAKKPYNPILGEIFRCYYNCSDATSKDNAELVEEGPVPWATNDSIAFIAEQVSHHPPISAFYAENAARKMSLGGYIWTKSKFLGLSIGVDMVGQAVLMLLEHGEEYVFNFPTAYGRSILTVPWMEIGGTITISCAKTGCTATIEFLTKPFWGGKRNQLRSEMFCSGDKKPYCVLTGDWTNVIEASFAGRGDQREEFINSRALPMMRKRVKPIAQQEPMESRHLWQDVTFHLKNKTMELATGAKHKLEKRQRDDAKKRADEGVKWKTRHFHERGGHWVYDRPLVQRLAAAGSASAPDN